MNPTIIQQCTHVMLNVWERGNCWVVALAFLVCVCVGECFHAAALPVDSFVTTVFKEHHYD